MNHQQDVFRPDLSMWTAIKRAVAGKCPSCGEGKLFRAYLKQVDECASCGEPLGEVRADDGPPWLTILLVGHILAPVLVLVTGQSLVPLWATAVAMMLVALGLSLALLPFSKAVFLAVIWKSKAGEEMHASFADPDAE